MNFKATWIILSLFVSVLQSSALRAGSPLDLCNTCNAIIQSVENSIPGQKTRDSIKEALQAVCGQIPQFFRAICLALANSNSDVIINSIISNRNPAQVCKELRICQ